MDSRELAVRFIEGYGRTGFQSDRAFVMYYTPDSARLTGELKDGSTVDAKDTRGDDWDGTLYALLAPRSELERVALQHDGKTKTYRLNEL